MAYDVTEERLKVKGSEQITRDLKVNRDAFINGKAETGSIDDKGDLKVAGEILAGDDVTISGDLYVNGTEYINDSETAQTTDNYLVLRHNQTTPLGTNEYSGVAVHNYASGKTATITTDKDGTWRVADNTETDTNYTNISYYNGTFYTGLTRTAATVISGMKTAFNEDELDESVYYNNSYYHFDGTNWFPVSLVDNKLTLGSAVTDSATITALNALTKEDLVYFRTLTITVINPVENQPLLTRAETGDLTGEQALVWDATNQKAVGKTIDTTVTANSSNLITSGAVSTCVTSAINDLDVSDVGGTNKYISKISETDGKISTVAGDIDTVVTTSSANLITSGAVKTAIDDEATARNNAIANAIDALDVTDSPVAGKYVSSVSETDGKITVVREDLGNLAVSGIKGNAELNYRRGLVNLTPADIGAVNKAGDTVTGSISRDSGGSYISGRDNAVIKQTKSNAEGQSWNPAISVKTVSGNWTIGSVGGETLQLSYDTDANYNVDNNDSAVINFPTAGSTGTLALTSQIPTANSQLTNDSGYLTASGTIANANHATSADSATNANHATNADSATNANHATNADSATNAGNADTVDGYHADTAANGSTVAARDPSGYLNARIFNDSWSSENINSYSSPTVMFKGNGDGYIRNTSLADLRTALGVPYAQVNSDWNATSGVAQILNKPSFDLDDTTNIKNIYVETDNQYAKCSVGRFLSNITKEVQVTGTDEDWTTFSTKLGLSSGALVYGWIQWSGDNVQHYYAGAVLTYTNSGGIQITLYADNKMVLQQAGTHTFTYNLKLMGGGSSTEYPKRKFNIIATPDHYELNGQVLDDDQYFPNGKYTNVILVYNLSSQLPQDLDLTKTIIGIQMDSIIGSYANLVYNLNNNTFISSPSLNPTSPVTFANNLIYNQTVINNSNYYQNILVPFIINTSNIVKVSCAVDPAYGGTQVRGAKSFLAPVTLTIKELY